VPIHNFWPVAVIHFSLLSQDVDFWRNPFISIARSMPYFDMVTAMISRFLRWIVTLRKNHFCSIVSMGCSVIMLQPCADTIDNADYLFSSTAGNHWRQLSANMWSEEVKWVNPKQLSKQWCIFPFSTVLYRQVTVYIECKCDQNAEMVTDSMTGV
jgi:hypothetical protein